MQGFSSYQKDSERAATFFAAFTVSADHASALSPAMLPDEISTRRQYAILCTMFHRYGLYRDLPARKPVCPENTHDSSLSLLNSDSSGILILIIPVRRIVVNGNVIPVTFYTIPAH